MMRRLWIAFVVFLTGCLFEPPDEHTPNGMRVLYQPGTSYRLPDAKLQEIDDRIAALHECLPEDAYCTHAIPEVYVTRDCDSIGTRAGSAGGEYDPAAGRLYVPRSLGALAHEGAHHYTCDMAHGSGSWSADCGNAIDLVFRMMNPPECGDD